MITAKEFEGELWIKASDHNQAVKAAIATEREACANSLEDWEKVFWNNWDCAEHIRKRDEK